MQSSLHQTSFTQSKIANFFFSFIVRFILKCENKDLKDNKLCQNISEQLKMLTKQYIIEIECIAKRFTFRISLTMSLIIIIFLRMSF